MIEIKTYNEQHDGKGVSYDTEIHIEGNGALVLDQLIEIFDHIYEVQPKIFEFALLKCQYTEDHT